MIRLYTPEDEASCMDAFISNVPKYFTENEISDFRNFLQELNQNNFEAKKETVFYFVIADNNKVIGCGGIGSSRQGNHISLIWGLIHNDYHEQGYGKALLQHRLSYMSTHFLDKELKIDTTQYSEGFFSKNGFETYKITKDFYEIGLDRYDMIWKKS
jgi:[ribosomal protein S18]-alanine N-acetyltransferase